MFDEVHIWSSPSLTRLVISNKYQKCITISWQPIQVRCSTGAAGIFQGGGGASTASEGVKQQLGVDILPFRGVAICNCSTYRYATGSHNDNITMPSNNAPKLIMKQILTVSKLVHNCHGTSVIYGYCKAEYYMSFHHNLPIQWKHLPKWHFCLPQ